MVGDKLALAVRGQLLGPVTAGMQEVVLKSPVLGEVIPTVVFLLPAVMSEAADQRGGKCVRFQGGKPQPLVLCAAGLQVSLTVVILREGFLGTQDADQLWVVNGEGKPFGIPELDLIGLAFVWFHIGGIGRALSKQANRRLIQLRQVLFEADDQIPTDLARQLEHRGLRVEGIEQEDVEEGAPVLAGSLASKRKAAVSSLSPGCSHSTARKGLTGLEMI